MKQIQKILLLALGLLWVAPVFASHNLGGELTFKYMGNNKFKFTLLYYRDCTGGPPSDPTVTLCCSTSTGGSITGLSATYTMNRIKISEISPQCVPLPGSNKPQQINCALPLNSTGTSSGTVERHVYESGLIDFSGVPAAPTGGYTFFVNYSCCRNSIVNTPCSDLCFRVKMFPYVVNGVSQTPVQAGFRDNSASFLEPPTTLLIQSSTDTFCFNNNGTDPDLDSMSYTFAYPWQGFNDSCTYNAPTYTLANPIPGLLPGVQPNSVTGSMCFKPTTTGNFLSCIKITSYRCGQRISEVYRDFQVQCLSAPTNYGTNPRPAIDTPFVVANVMPVVRSYDGTFYAGDTIDFSLGAIDGAGYTYNPGNFQNISIYFTGTEFGTGYTQTTGCPYPPCATLQDPQTGAAPVPILLRGDTLGYGFTGSTSTGTPIGARFYWITNCSNLPLNACGVLKNIYNFTVTAKDDYCPVNGKLIQPVSITILPTRILSPAPICISVNADSTITLNWKKRPDPRNAFLRNIIYRSNNPAGPFSAIDSINVANTTTWHDVNANAYTNTYYYYVATRSGCYDLLSKPNDLVHPIIVRASRQALGIAVNWNNPHAAFPPAQLLDTFPHLNKIFRQVNSGPWTFIANLTDTATHYYDSLSVCNDSVTYRFERYDSLGNCTSISTLGGARYADTVNALKPVLLNVSADTAGTGIKVTWKANAELDIRGYILYRFVCGSNAIQQQWNIVGRLDTTFIDNTVQSNQGVFCYGLVAYDSCFTDTAPSLLSSVQHNILLTAELKKCLGNITLQWNEYTGWATPSNVAGYVVFRDDSTLTSPLALDTIGVGAGEYIDTTIQKGYKYCYNVVAVDANGSYIPQNMAISNTVCLDAKKVVPPKFSYIRYATVDGTNAIRIGWLVDTTADVLHYRVERSPDGGNTFESLAEVAPNPWLRKPLATIEFTDVDVDAELNTYTYRIVVVDSCGRDALVSSDTATTILLDGNANFDFSNTLTWSPYQGWQQGVAQYLLLRQVPDVETAEKLVNSTSADTLTHKDFIEEYLESNGKICYRIRAVEKGPNSFGLIDTAYSNTLCLVQPPRLYTPNAFAPEGRNALFFPKRIFAENNNYTMNIYSRWGENIFSTDNWDKGWDGIWNGKDAPSGIYIWVIRFKGKDGHFYEQTGSLTLIR